MKALLMTGQIVTMSFWVAVLSTFAIAWPAPLDSIVPGLGALVLAAHVLEVLVLQKKIRSLSNNLMKDNIMVLIFGVFHMAALTMAGAKKALKPSA